MRCQPPVRTLRRLGFLLLLSSIASLASAQYTTYQIYVNDAAIPAGVRGFASGGVVNDPPAGSAAPFNICFYTGFGSTAPIVPTGYVNQGDYATFNYAIPISTIQDVPNTSFSKGLFTAVVYTIPTSFKSCTGVGQSLGNSANVTLNYPIVTGVSLPAVPAQNPALATRLPSSLAIFGSYFISMRGSNPHSPSTVDFVSSNTVPATDRFVSSGSLVSTIPATLPATQRPLSVKVCNTSVYSYCGSSPTIKVLPLQADSGTLTATPTATTPAPPWAARRWSWTRPPPSSPHPRRASPSPPRPSRPLWPTSTRTASRTSSSSIPAPQPRPLRSTSSSAAYPPAASLPMSPSPCSAMAPAFRYSPLRSRTSTPTASPTSPSSP